MDVILTPEIIFDESKNSYEVSIKELSATSCGDSLETAVDRLIDKIENLAFTYFDDFETYFENENYTPYYDYFIKISRCTTKDELLEIIGLKN